MFTLTHLARKQKKTYESISSLKKCVNNLIFMFSKAAWLDPASSYLRLEYFDIVEAVLG